MDGITMEAIGSVLNSFGAWGLCAVLLWKDITINKTMTEALNKFTVALNILTGQKVDN